MLGMNAVVVLCGSLELTAPSDVVSPLLVFTVATVAVASIVVLVLVVTAMSVAVVSPLLVSFTTGTVVPILCGLASSI